jgi:DNA excision repair protein ERCC-4
MKYQPRTPSQINKHITDYKPKPFQFPPDMTILMDTREQLPLFARPPKGMVVCSCTLSVGDYSLKGLQDKIAIERKQISDLISYCTTDRENTKIKMRKLQSMQFAALVIEARESEVYRPYTFSQASPESIRQSLASFSVRYGVHVYIGDRDKITTWIIDRLIKFWKISHEL